MDRTVKQQTMDERARRGPLADTVVIDLSRALAGPHATMMLGDQGARVIKVENPRHGDDSRSWGPPFVGPSNDPQSTYFLSCNRNKESVRLDLKSGEGKQALTELLRNADVLVENFRSGVLDRLGFSLARLQEINPRLVVLSITGFGHDGPDARRAGYDQIAQGEAGLMSLTGPDEQTPTRVGVPIADLVAGMYGAFGVTAALAERSRTGRGMVVRTSLLAALVGVHAFQGTRWTVAGEVQGSQGNQHPSIAPYGTFRCADGLIQVAVATDAQWRGFAGIVGIDPADIRFATNHGRIGRRHELVTVIESALLKDPRAVWLARFDEIGVPAGAIRNLDEVYAHPQTLSQGLLIEVDHPVLGTVELPGPPLRLAGLDGSTVSRSQHTAPPLLGQHDDSVRSWLAAAAQPDTYEEEAS